MRRLLLLFVFACGCGKSGDPTPPPTSAPAPPPMFGSAQPGASDPWTECATCHGPDGHGDGAMARNLPSPPQNLADPKWQKSVSDADISKAIVGGGAAIGKSPAMPAHANLSDDQVKQLVARIRSLR